MKPLIFSTLRKHDFLDVEGWLDIPQNLGNYVELIVTTEGERPWVVIRDRNRVFYCHAQLLGTDNSDVGMSDPDDLFTPNKYQPAPLYGNRGLLLSYVPQGKNSLAFLSLNISRILVYRNKKVVYAHYI